MASLMDKKVVKNDDKFIIGIVTAVLFLVWFFWPNANNVVRVGYWIKNIQYSVSTTFKIGKMAEYQHHLENARYIAQMYPNRPKHAIYEMNKAIEKAPDYISEMELSKLYVNRAILKLYYGDKKGAMSDYMLAKNLDMTNDFRLAALLTENRQYQLASEYCKDILNKNNDAFYGYACFANVYASVNRKDAAIKVYDMAIDKKPNNARAYVERANMKKSVNDIKGYEEDISTAKSLLPNINLEQSVVQEAISSKKELLASMII